MIRPTHLLIALSVSVSFFGFACGGGDQSAAPATNPALRANQKGRSARSIQEQEPDAQDDDDTAVEGAKEVDAPSSSGTTRKPGPPPPKTTTTARAPSAPRPPPERPPRPPPVKTKDEP
jgi:hypothetical protein